MSSRNNPARVAIVMGSKSDWATMQFAAEIFEILNVPHHVEVVSAHRTPDKLFSFAESAEENGYQVIIAGAGGAPAWHDCHQNAGASAGRASTERRTERCR